MDYSKEYDYLVQRFLPGDIIRSMGYDVRKCSQAEVDQLLCDNINIKNHFWGKSNDEFEKHLKNIIKMYPLVFCDPKAVQRLQQLCMLFDITAIPDEALKDLPLEYARYRQNTYEQVSKYIIYPSKDFRNSNKLSENLPSDRIIIDNTIINKIENIWNKDRKNLSAPCDLINAEILPAPDIEIQLDKTIYRVRIDTSVDDFGTEVTFDNRRKHIGFIQTHSLEIDKDLTVEISEDISGLICMEGTVFLNPNNKKMESIDYFELCQMTSNIMRIWYGLQLLMLHPKIKYVFTHPKMQTFFNIYSRKENKKHRKTYSIKTIKITNTMLDIPSENTGNEHRTYQCPLWWVIGHKRVKCGKVEWVRGYWKGELKDLGKPQEYEIRERIIV